MPRIDEINPNTEPYRDPHGEGLATLGAQRVAALSWTDDNGPHEFTLEGPTTVGSAPSCKLVVADPHVSRVHLELSPTDAGIVIRDLGSKNGTFLGLNQIHHFTARTDVRIRLGGTVEIHVQHRADPVNVPLWRQSRYGQLIGRSAVMRRVFDELSRLANNDETVLIQGESGTGKELAAAAIHSNSKRRRKPYVIVDCGALSPQLVESELFGHARGAFTGATQAREGAFEAADGGTLFLTRSASCRSRCSRSCCVSSKRERFAVSARPSTGRWTCA